MEMTLASDINLVSNGTSKYIILTDPDAGEIEQKAAEILQHYIYKVSDTQIDIVDNNARKRPYIKLKNIDEQKVDSKKHGY